jgi:hypothetical protein
MHPLTPDLTKLKDDEVQAKFGDLVKRLNQAYRVGPYSLVPQLQMLLGDYQDEITRRNQKHLEEMDKKMEKAMGGKKAVKDILDIK